MQTRWVNATFWGPDPRLHPGIVYSQYARDVDVEPGAASKIRNPKISGSWRKFPRKSLRCPWVPGTLHPIAMLQLHPNHCKAQAVQPSENIPSIRYVRTCATTTTYDNVRQRPTRYFLGATGWEECGLEDYGGGGCCSCRHLEAMKSHEKHSSQRKQIQVSRTNPSFEIFFHTNAIDFSEMLVCSNSQIQTKGWFDVSGLSHSLAFTNPNKLNLLISFLLCYDRSGVTFLQAWCDPATLGVQCPPRVHTNQTIAPEGHPPAAHLQSTSTLYICTYKNHQRTARPINNNDSIDVHIHVCTHKYFSICYAKRWNEFQCDAKPPRNPTRNPCVSSWRQFQCLHAGNQNLCRCQR